jgi:dolichol-phosphate mannosyltransferase
MAVSDTFVSIVAPLWNDGDIVADFLRDTVAVMRAHFANYEIVLVDDGSTDDTAARVNEELGRHEYLRLIRLSRHFGEEVAVSAGLDSVIGDYVVVMRPDSDPPEVIPQMVDRARHSGGTVLGVRTRRKRENPLVRLGAWILYWYCNRVLKLNLYKISEHFLVMSRQAVNGVFQIKDRLRHLRVFTAYVGFASEEFPYEPISRRGRHRRRGLVEAIDLGISIIVANSAHPLRLVSWLGLALSGLNVLYVVYVLLTYYFSPSIAEGWATRSIQTSGMFFFVFLILAVLCEYVGRILSETQNRPHYYVLEERNSNSMLLAEERKNVTTRSVDA